MQKQAGDKESVQIDQEIIKLTIQNDVLQFKAKYKNYMSLLEQGESCVEKNSSESTDYQQKQKLVKAKKKRDIVIDSLLHEMQNDLKLVDLELFGSLFKKVVDSMRTDFQSFARFYERVFQSQDLQMLDEEQPMTPSPLKRGRQSSLLNPGNLQQINSIKSQLRNQEYMLDIRTKAMQEQEKDKQNLEYQLQQVETQQKKIQFINSNLINFIMKINKQKGQEMPNKCGWPQKGGGPEQPMTLEYVSHQQRQQVLQQLNTFFYDLVINKAQLSEELKLFMNQTTTVSRTQMILSEYAHIFKQSELESQKNNQKMNTLRLLDYDKLQQQFGELLSLIRKSKEQAQLHLLEDSDNEVTALVNGMLGLANQLLQDRIQKKRDEEWPPKEQMAMVNQLEQQILEELRIKVRQEQGAWKDIIQYLEIISRQLEHQVEKEQEYNQRLQELKVTIQSGQVNTHRLKEKNIILKQQNQILVQDNEQQVTQIKIYQAKIQELCDRLQKSQALQRSSSKFRSASKSISGSVEELPLDNLNTKSLTAMAIENSSFKILLKKKQGEIQELNFQLNKQQDMIQELNKQMEEVRRELEQVEKEKEDMSQSQSLEVKRMDLKVTISKEFQQKKLTRLRGRLNQTKSQTMIIHNQNTSAQEPSSLLSKKEDGFIQEVPENKDLDKQQQALLNFIYLNFKMDNEHQVQSLKKLLKYLSGQKESLSQEQLTRVFESICFSDVVYGKEGEVGITRTHSESILQKIKMKNKSLLQSVVINRSYKQKVSGCLSKVQAGTQYIKRLLPKKEHPSRNRTIRQ